MEYIVLNGQDYQDRKDFYKDVRQKFDFPDYFGRNLDALHDCLTEVGRDVTVLLLNRDALSENLGAYAEKIVRVLKNSAEENDYLTFRTMLLEEE